MGGDDSEIPTAEVVFALLDANSVRQKFQSFDNCGVLSQCHVWCFESMPWCFESMSVLSQCHVVVFY